jgi:hypothetical protein
LPIDQKVGKAVILHIFEGGKYSNNSVFLVGKNTTGAYN